jgi:putative CocE/NonD family hydrolase
MRRLFTVAVTATLFASLGIAGPRAGAQDATDPLLTDSLTALTSLVAPTTCVPRDAADDDVANGIELPYRFCDDGLVPSGGGSNGIPVPVKYAANAAGDDWSGLPAPAPQTEADAADATDDLQPESDNRITLDVDITLPPEGMIPPVAGFPVIAFMHGCCGGNRTSWEAATVDAAGETWHHSNAWYAARGYVVVNYTARGFRTADDEGSTGTTQLDSRRYEVNDFQYLVGLLADHDAAQDSADAERVFNINPKRIGAVGGSYGGGFSWLALTDPTWRSPVARVRMKLAAVVPKYGWTDLVEALVPSGHYFDRNPETKKTFIAPTDPANALSRAPVGVEKQSIVSGLYATGNLVTGNHTTFPQLIHDAYARLQQGEPYDGDADIEALLDDFLNNRSAYFQQKFFQRVAKGLRVPVFAAATWTDPLFPTMESMRFYNKLKKIAPDYPITVYLGDYQHFVANKATEWGDLCGEDHHICTLEDFRRPNGSLDFSRSATRLRLGINTRIYRFLEYHLKGTGKKPAANVSATTTICAANASDGYPVTEPGIEYRAATWRALAPNDKTFGWEGGGALTTTTSTAAQDNHASDSDPVFRGQQANKCYTTGQTMPSPGVVQYVSPAVEAPFVMMGVPTVRLAFDTSATDYWLAARLFDLAPSGDMTLVTRGVCRVNTAAAPDVGCEVFDLFGNAWTFEAGHSVVLEVSQSDVPFLRRDNFPSMASFTEAEIVIPITAPALRRDFRD